MAMRKMGKASFFHIEDSDGENKFILKKMKLVIRFIIYSNY
ncbi:MAG: hypothetical protein CM1200mP33_0180 [Chloroflexota bacterium]|nr:MAG: hypothetical protein CM1200mP33_0180 [Chloroflexota bacterium]